MRLLECVFCITICVLFTLDICKADMMSVVDILFHFTSGFRPAWFMLTQTLHAGLNGAYLCSDGSREAM